MSAVERNPEAIGTKVGSQRLVYSFQGTRMFPGSVLGPQQDPNPGFGQGLGLGPDPGGSASDPVVLLRAEKEPKSECPETFFEKVRDFSRSD